MGGALAGACTSTPSAGVDAAPALEQCLRTDDDTCLSFSRGVLADCLARRAACLTDAGTGGFSDDLCITVAALNADGVGGVPSCLAQPCEQVSACLVALGSFTY